MEPPVPPVKLVPQALLAQPVAMALLVLKVSQVSQVQLVLPAPLVSQAPLLLLPFLRCLLALASSTAWCALLSQENQSQALPYHSPGMASREPLFCPAPLARSVSTRFLPKISLLRHKLPVKRP